MAINDTIFVKFSSFNELKSYRIDKVRLRLGLLDF